MIFEKSMPCVRRSKRSDGIDQIKNGYVLPLALTLVLLTSLSTVSAIHLSSTHIRLLNSEKRNQESFQLTEKKVIHIEKLLLAGTPISNDDEVTVELFKPKYFRARSGVLSQHYKVKVSSRINNHSQYPRNIVIQTTIRIDEKNISQKSKITQKKRSLYRLSWELIS